MSDVCDDGEVQNLENALAEANDDLRTSLKLLNEAEATLNRLCGDWGHGSGSSGSLVDRIRDFLVRHGVRPPENR